ncbi:MAG: N-acetyl-gamma-glutamyl-phosphate reductase [Treponematales bacterium]
MIAGVIGATGYAGAEAARLLAGHPEVEGLKLASVSFEGGRMEEVYPNFLGAAPAALVKPEEALAGTDVVFAALPSGVGEGYAKTCAERGVPFIDLSADFRFGGDEAAFQAWYGKPYLYPELRGRAVYGLTEFRRERLRELAASGPVIVGNPGCYPTGASLGAWPALERGLFGGDGAVIVDAASGVTGGGREPRREFHFPECADSVAPYKVGSHRHTPEISRNFAEMAGRPVSVVFTPHLAPMNRGILSTIYIPLAPRWRANTSRVTSGTPLPPARDIGEKAGEIRRVYADFYRGEPFVRVLPEGVPAATNRVRLSNYCDISIHLDHSGRTLIVISAIDNMVKGAAGQAVQNMNVIKGYAETAGLEAVPSLF